MQDGDRLSILKQELTILATKIGGTVDTLWKIRGLSLTLWAAVLAVGVGNFSSSRQPVVVLLVLCALLPLLFLFVDAKNNQWYRRLKARDAEIQQFLNFPEYRLPATDQPATLHLPVSGDTSLFPVYDLAGTATFGSQPGFQWETTILRSIADPIPIIVYCSQFAFSCLVGMIYAGPLVRQSLLLLIILVSVLLALLLVVAYRKERVFRARAPDPIKDLAAHASIVFHSRRSS